MRHSSLPQTIPSQCCIYGSTTFVTLGLDIGVWPTQPPHIFITVNHNERDGASNHRCFDCLLERLFRRRSKNTSRLHVTGLCVGNSLATGEFPAQRATNAENASIWWRHNVLNQYSWHLGLINFQPRNLPESKNYIRKIPRSWFWV